MTDSNQICLALGGGGARGISHVHVLRAIDDLGVGVTEIVGSSIGAVVGAGYASGMSGTEIEDMFWSTFSNRSSVFTKLWKIRPGLINTLAGEGSGLFGQMDIEQVLDAFLPEELPRDFAELKIPLTITGTDYYGNSLKCLQSGDLRKAIAASAAIPVIFRPVVIDGCVLIDGGINNPLPFDVLDRNKAPAVAVDVVGLPRRGSSEMPSRIDAAYGASQLMMQSITNLKLEHNPPQVFLRPPVDHYRVMDFLKVNEILEETSAVYEEAKRKIAALFEPSQTSVPA